MDEKFLDEELNKASITSGPCLVDEDKKFHDTVVLSFVCGNYCSAMD